MVAAVTPETAEGKEANAKAKFGAAANLCNDHGASNLKLCTEKVSCVTESVSVDQEFDIEKSVLILYSKAKQEAACSRWITSNKSSWTYTGKFEFVKEPKKNKPVTNTCEYKSASCSIKEKDLKKKEKKCIEVVKASTAKCCVQDRQVWDEAA